MTGPDRELLLTEQEMHEALQDPTSLHYLRATDLRVIVATLAQSHPQMIAKEIAAANAFTNSVRQHPTGAGTRTYLQRRMRDGEWRWAR